MNMMTMRIVRTPDGGMRHVPAPFTPAPAKRGQRKRTVPDPIRTNGDGSAEQLRLLVERIERMDAEILAAQDDRRDILSEAKAVGFDPTIMLMLIARRKKEKHLIDEQDSIFETYATALGLL